MTREFSTLARGASRRDSPVLNRSTLARGASRRDSPVLNRSTLARGASRRDSPVLNRSTGNFILTRHKPLGLVKLWLMILVLAVLGRGVNSDVRAQDPFGQEATWATPRYDEAREEVLGWLDELDVDEETRGKLESIWPEEGGGDTEVELLDLVTPSIAILEPASDQLLRLLMETRPRGLLPTFEVLEDESLFPPLAAHLRLLYGRWLVQQEMFDESLEQLGALEPSQVLAPATLLFHQSVAHHRLLQKDECLPKLARLLENENQIPRRYRELTRLMESDLRPLKEDSLDEIARIMDNVTRRLNLGRAGQRVRQEEDDVVAKLDKMIEQLEQQQQQQQQQQAGGGGGQGQMPRSSSPMEDSRAAGGSGPGNVTPRHIGRGDGWGNLPPKEREEAMQEITKNLPAHYRDVIEEYFRKLARSSD